MTGASQPATAGDRRSLFDRLLRVPALVSGALLAGIMLLTVADVALRYLFNAPLIGGLEMTELAMVALIMLALPHCSATNGHVRVDVLERALGHRGRLFGDALTAVLSLAVLGFLVWNTVHKAADAYEFEDRVNTLLAPLWPFYALIAASMAVYALIVARDLIRLALRQGGEHE